jgi:hypothetical protein
MLAALNWSSSATVTATPHPHAAREAPSGKALKSKRARMPSNTVALSSDARVRPGTDDIHAYDRGTRSQAGAKATEFCGDG